MPTSPCRGRVRRGREIAERRDGVVRVGAAEVGPAGPSDLPVAVDHRSDAQHLVVGSRNAGGEVPTFVPRGCRRFGLSTISCQLSVRFNDSAFPEN